MVNTKRRGEKLQRRSFKKEHGKDTKIFLKTKKNAR